MATPKKAAKAEKKVTDEDMQQAAPAAPVVEGDAVFVNREKLNRAKLIVALVNGTKVPANDQETERKDHYSRQFAAAEVNPKSTDAVRFAYETLLGGLVRTPEEQEVADADAAEARRKQKKNRIEPDAK